MTGFPAIPCTIQYYPVLCKIFGLTTATLIAMTTPQQWPAGQLLQHAREREGLSKAEAARRIRRRIFSTRLRASQ
ncbi:hypothetical protein U2A4042360200 [Corynebacterium striatum]|nr:hypothetical protein U2A4042360200 [Corynebacterium striatum]